MFTLLQLPAPRMEHARKWEVEEALLEHLGLQHRRGFFCWSSGRTVASRKAEKMLEKWWDQIDRHEAIDKLQQEGSGLKGCSSCSGCRTVAGQPCSLQSQQSEGFLPNGPQCRWFY